MTQHICEVLEIPGVGQRVERDHLVARVHQKMADHVRGDEPGAAGDENALHGAGDATPCGKGEASPLPYGAATERRRGDAQPRVSEAERRPRFERKTNAAWPLPYSSRSIAYSGLPSTSRWMRPRYSPTSARTNPAPRARRSPRHRGTAGPGSRTCRSSRRRRRCRGPSRPGCRRTQHDAGPLDRLRPEACEDVEGETGQPQGRVAGGSMARGMPDVDLDHRGAAREDQRLGELLPSDRAEHRRDDGAPIRVERTAEVGDVDAREPPQHPVDQSRGNVRPQESFRATRRPLATS